MAKTKEEKISIGNWREGLLGWLYKATVARLIVWTPSPDGSKRYRVHVGDIGLELLDFSDGKNHCTALTIGKDGESLTVTTNPKIIPGKKVEDELGLAVFYLTIDHEVKDRDLLHSLRSGLASLLYPG